MGGKGLFGLRIKLAGLGIAFDGAIELLRFKGFKPCAKPCELARGKLFNGFFNVFGGSHVGNIAFACESEKGRLEAYPRIKSGGMPRSKTLYCSERRTICRPLFSALSSLTYASGRVQRDGVFNPMNDAISPMKPVQLLISAFHTGEFSFRCLM
jgi:hypothetical protein